MRRSFVELLGTFALVFIGVGTIMAVGPQADAGTLEVAFASRPRDRGDGHGRRPHLGWLLQPGDHFRVHADETDLGPARSRLLVAQFAGGVLAALLLRWIFPAANRDATNLGAPARHTIDLGPALVVEALLTFFLVWVVFATTADPRSTYSAVAGIAIGLVVVFDNLMGYPLTSAIVNPARALGPQLVGNSWTDWWIWYVGPLAGGAIAALLYDELYLRPQAPAATAEPPPPASSRLALSAPATGR